jgi:putative mycofactocin binding protein MftB
VFLAVNAERSYEVPAKVSVRQERFGGLVYRYDNRALLFLHSRPLVDFLVELDGGRPLGAALEEFAAKRGLDDRERRALENALGQLEVKGIIREL